ncbi:MAG: hypothetical protein Q9228_004908 [Teloschistes exilis]
MDLPMTVEEILGKHTLHDDEEIDHSDCPICFVPYRSLPSFERPLKTPGCRHIMGRTCLALWLAENNSCPVCRAPVLALDVPRNAMAELEEQIGEESARGLYWRFRLVSWIMPRTLITPHYFKKRSPFESSFWQLCEAIVSIMEGVSTRSSAQEWFDFVKYLHIMYLGSFFLFRYVLTEEIPTLRVDYTALLSELRGLVPDPSVMDEVMVRVRDTSDIPDATPAQIEENMAPFEGYYARVKAARDAMYERL